MGFNLAFKGLMSLGFCVSGTGKIVTDFAENYSASMLRFRSVQEEYCAASITNQIVILPHTHRQPPDL